MTDHPGISGLEIVRLLDLVEQWSRRRGEARPTAIRAVRTTRDAAIKVLHRDRRVGSDPGTPIYLVSLEGRFACSASLLSPTNSPSQCAALVIDCPPVKVLAMTIRPLEDAVDIATLGAVQALAL